MSESISKEREKQIIKAARSIFARYGFSKTTMDDISAEVEMGKASLYYYFPTKESLFEAVVSQERGEFMQRVECILAIQNSSAQKLRTYGEERIKLIQELMNLGMLSYHTYIEKRSVYQKLTDEFSRREMEVIERIIKEGIVSGEFQSDLLPEQLSSVLVHLLQGLRLRAMKGSSGLHMDNQTYLELCDEMMVTIDVFLRAIKLS